MILDTLNTLGIPYIVVKSKITSPITDNVVYEYTIVAEYDIRLRRLKFSLEREIFKYRRKYVYRIMNAREIKIFKSIRHAQPILDEYGCIWEFNGKLRKYKITHL